MAQKYVRLKNCNCNRCRNGIRLSPQAVQLIEILKRDGRATRLTLMHYGIANPTARMAEIRHELGIDVACEIKRDFQGRRYGVWTLPDAYFVEVFS